MDAADNMTDQAGDGTGPVTVAPTPAYPPELDAEAQADEPENVAGRKSPLRRCVATGRVGDKAGMIRFVVSPDGVLVPDVDETLPGRGLWLTADAKLVEKALTKGLFAKAARRAVKPVPDLPALLCRLVRRRALGLVGLARKGGGALAGFEKVQAALRSGCIGRSGGAGQKSVGLWFEASDGSDDGRTKLFALAQALGVPLVDVFDRSELGAALGRDEAVHVVLAAGPLAKQIRREVERLSALGGAGS
ncbi:RNA-binding protein [Niveispirillum sp. BGYR6]|uniref:RNA-binding protein n=1 Tax=Niveispirillum sp. BGYR6 TaxID=2971249 RepID=UPI0022B975EA|nr:RNA-binding protein [Niveispirillum sp. BGYR6]MDG5495380.1 RNA-binding protein [Niveispirillum sp. BGYR6]